MLENIKSIYIVGIGGISLSAIALILKNKGFDICGSDLEYSNEIAKLQQQNIKVVIGHSKDFVLKCDALVYSLAVENDEDVLLAKKLNKKIFSRAEILGMLSQGYQTISIAGTHGKTTTTGLISSIFLEAKKDPNIHIGGVLNNINSNVNISISDILITEACEYKDSFLFLKNTVSVILNIKEDHLDYFKNIDNIFNSFQKFSNNTLNNGIIVINSDDKLCCKIKNNSKILTYGIENLNAELRAINIVEQTGKYCFDVVFRNEKLFTINLPCYGRHNIYNALASIGVSLFYGIEREFIKRGIENFKGVKRRFEYINELNNNLIIHDYAHHPDEIKAVIETGNEIKKEKIIVIFQPHTYSRTKLLFKDFIKSLELCDEVWLLPIYPAREKPIKNVSSYKLYKSLKSKNVKVKYFQSFLECYSYLKKYKENNKLFEILGAGDIVKLADMLR